MLAGQHLWKSIGIWLGLLCFGTLVSAQNPALVVGGPQFASPAGKRFYFGVMGQVAKPGVYELDTPQPQLLDLIGHAGGLTTQATNQIRVVRQGNAGQSMYFTPTLYFPLISGDIVVADGPLISRVSKRQRTLPRPRSPIRNADFVEEEDGDNSENYAQVALMNVLDRPVILPVPEAHANVRAVVAYLGQTAAVAAEVEALPVGPGRGFVNGDHTASAKFIVPTVLYFNPQSLDRSELPKFPDLYKPGEHDSAPPRRIEEPKTAALLPKEAASVERFQRPGLHSTVVLPVPAASDFPEPPMIANVREMERRIPTPQPQAAKTSSATPNASPAPLAEAARPAADSEDDPQAGKSSGWSYLLWLVLIGVLAGTYFKLRGRKPLPARSTPAAPSAIHPFEPPLVSAALRPSQQAASSLPGPEEFLTDEILTALAFNQLPVKEVPEEATPVEPPADQPAPRKFFRFDPPEERSAGTANEPRFKKHAQPPKSAAEETIAEIGPKIAQTPDNPPEARQRERGLLDRVLERVHQNRAA